MWSSTVKHLFAFTLAIAVTWSRSHGADVLSHWNGGTGDWTNSLNWTHIPAELGGDYPHNGFLTYDAQIDDGGVTIDTAITLEQFSIAGGSISGLGSLTLNQGLSISGSLIQIGLPQINLRGRSILSLAPCSVINARQLLLTNTSVVEFELGPSGSGVINQTEWGWLDGTLRLRLAHGFIPAVGTRYTLFTRLAAITQFPRHEGLEIGNGLRLVPHYDGSTLDVVVMNAPQPGQTALTVKRIPLQRMTMLNWPPEYAGFYLQYTTNLTNPNWTTLFLTWTNEGNLAISSGFFRLVQP